MSLPAPEKHEETPLVTLGLGEAVLALLIRKGYVTEDEGKTLVAEVAERFAASDTPESQAAHRFLTEWLGQRLTD